MCAVAPAVVKKMQLRIDTIYYCKKSTMIQPFNILLDYNNVGECGLLCMHTLKREDVLECVNS